MANVTAVIAAAGQGKRMGGPLNKQFMLLGGLPVLARTIQVFENISMVTEIYIIVNEDDMDFCKREVVDRYSFQKVAEIVAGGRERQDSVFNGLRKINRDTEIVLIHDGARPLVTEDIIRSTVEMARDFGAVVAAVPVKDTVKIVDQNGIVLDTPDRNSLWAVQTPQAFKYSIIKEAYEKAYQEGFYGTDDAMLAERAGYHVKIIMGSYENIKVTTPEDIILAEALLQRRVK